MCEIYTEVESKLFCLFLLIFLYLFKVNNYQKQYMSDKLSYLFSFCGIGCSIFGEVLQKETMQTLCFVVSGTSYVLAMWFLCICTFKETEFRPNIMQKNLCLFASVVFGCLTFFALKIRIDAPDFIVTFFLVILLFFEQHHKIRTDNLTRLYNRYGMDTELRKQLKEFEREPEDSFYIIACDLDDFKSINDTWGHSEGDRALTLVAKALSKISRKFSAKVFRIGGDEFIIIVDNFKETISTDITEAIKTALDHIDFRPDYDLKISIGSAYYDGLTSIDELLINADKKLYEAKKLKIVQ